MPDVKRRAYSSPLRAQQAAESRAAVVAAAQRLFEEQGYGATTIDQIAAAAGVSKPTVFAAVGNKVEVFRTARDIAMAGDDEPQDVPSRPSVEAISTAANFDSAVQAAVAHISSLVARYHALDAVLRGATGDPAMRELAVKADAERYAGAGFLLKRLTEHGRRPVKRAQDRLWLVMAPDNYTRLVVARGWSDREFRTWLGEQIGALFAPS